MYDWLNIIQDYLLPPTCVLCGNPGHQRRDLCLPCYRQLPRNTQCCYQCADGLDTTGAAPNICGRCLSLRPAFDETHAPFLYDGAVRYLIARLKFGADYKNARLLGSLLAEHVRSVAEHPELIVPVPLHCSRYRERGFNQALEIARTVARELAIPLDWRSCRRLRATPHQTGLSAQRRRGNLRQAFAVTRPVKARHVALLDDVMTTGATVHELARVLKKAGVVRVDVWVCARA